MDPKRFWNFLILAVLVVGLLPTALAAAPLDAAPDSLAGSTVEVNDCYEGGVTQSLAFTAFNASGDDEWIDVVEVTFPAGWTVACDTQDAADSCGNGVAMSCAVAGTTVTYADNNGGYGEILPTCTWGFSVDVTVPGGTSGTQPVDWHLSGDDWGGTPHDVYGTVDVLDCNDIGELGGTVYDLNDMSPPCTSAAVSVEPVGLNVPVDPATGDYGPVALGSGTYTVTASAPGYADDGPYQVVVAAGMTTTQDFALERPVVEVNPSDFISITAPVDVPVVYPLTIANLGQQPLDFEILEIPPTVVKVEQGAPAFQTTWLEGDVAVDPQVLDELDARGTTDFFVQMRLQVDLSPASGIEDWSARGRYVYDALREAAEAQAPVKAYLKEQGLEFETRLGNNAVFVKGGTLDEVDALAARLDVKAIRANHVYQIEEDSLPATPDAWGWNLDQLDPNNSLFGMEAAQVWQDFGVFGDGIVVANIDTGVYYQHEALDRQYRGNLTGNTGGPYDHNFDWYMPTSGCGDGTYPCDNNSHGSGTMGIMVGENADQSEQIGIAPAATWIACKGCESSSCSEAALTGCADWLVAPCPIGVAPGDPSCDPDMRPHIINNSWGGGSCDTWYQGYIQAWVAAGQFPAFSAGNTTACSALGSPGDTPEAFATAAHNSSGDNLYAGGPSCYFNPPSCDPGAHEVDPHLNAPTYGRSADNTGGYFNIGGTSGASPHTGGCVALLWAANPSLIGNMDATFTILEQTADRSWTDPAAVGSCGKPACAGSDPYPNYEYGWGFLDCYAAMETAYLADLPWVWTDPISGTVPAMDGVTLDVTFQCTETRDYVGTLRVSHNDPCQAPVDVPIVLHCGAEPPQVEWYKTINGVEWQPGISVTVETSDTIEVVDVLNFSMPPTNILGHDTSFAPAGALPQGPVPELDVTSMSPEARAAAAPEAPANPEDVLWDQPLSAVNQNAYANQDFEATYDPYDIFIADDFDTVGEWWAVDTIFVPGNTWNTGCDLTCADSLNWMIFADGGGVPDGDPYGGGNPPVWVLNLPPTDPAVTITAGTGGYLSNVTLDHVAFAGGPLMLPPGQYWLVFYPSMELASCCQYGRQPSDTANGYVAQVINPGGGLGFPTTWTSVQVPATWGLLQQDFAFRIEGTVGAPPAFELVEAWNPDELMLLDFDISAGEVFTQDGQLVWVGPMDGPPVVTMTKWFHVEPCTWTETGLMEQLWVEGIPLLPKPVLFNKLQPDLWIDAGAYDQDTYPGGEASFTLLYGNEGGYENDVTVANEFPMEAPFLSAVPAPDYVSPDGLWVEWAVGDLAMDDEGSIEVTVAVSDTLGVGAWFTVTDWIIDHTDVPADEVEIPFYVGEPISRYYLPIIVKNY